MQYTYGEIIDGTIAYINNKEITITQLMKHISPWWNYNIKIFKTRLQQR